MPDNLARAGCANHHEFRGLAFAHAFQPIVDPRTREIVSYEALMRGPAGESALSVLSAVPAADFLDFDQFSREKALGRAVALGLQTRINLNCSPAGVFHQGGYYMLRTIAAAEKLGFNPANLVIEITESEAVSDYERLKRQLNRLRTVGVKFAIDDFGSGYAGLNLLAEIQPEQIKLDIGLVRNIQHEGARQSITRAICDVCVDLGIYVIAEGVETRAEFEWLQSLDVDYYQGYLFARPGFDTLPPVTDWGDGGA